MWAAARLLLCLELEGSMGDGGGGSTDGNCPQSIIITRLPRCPAVRCLAPPCLLATFVFFLPLLLPSFSPALALRITTGRHPSWRARSRPFQSLSPLGARSDSGARYWPSEGNSSRSGGGGDWSSEIRISQFRHDGFSCQSCFCMRLCCSVCLKDDIPHITECLRDAMHFPSLTAVNKELSCCGHTRPHDDGCCHDEIPVPCPGSSAVRTLSLNRDPVVLHPVSVPCVVTP